ncbi:hypothetical protein MNV_50017 [Candidatus Methanoperedens nitroreducens]|uniref:Uncharacterized protein n=1 Tax=Candidatus Methanoperedens nitratireducens TaxID=1392998 RepID=A0A284VRC2_9EURY|nr:hypothetical protein MNV_50017 [Candidatus Methanoperedens nitroreducens]
MNESMVQKSHAPTYFLEVFIKITSYKGTKNISHSNTFPMRWKPYGTSG